MGTFPQMSATSLLAPPRSTSAPQSSRHARGIGWQPGACGGQQLVGELLVEQLDWHRAERAVRPGLVPKALHAQTWRTGANRPVHRTRMLTPRATPELQRSVAPKAPSLKAARDDLLLEL